MGGRGSSSGSGKRSDVNLSNRALVKKYGGTAFKMLGGRDSVIW